MCSQPKIVVCERARIFDSRIYYGEYTYINSIYIYGCAFRGQKVETECTCNSTQSIFGMHAGSVHCRAATACAAYEFQSVMNNNNNNIILYPILYETYQQFALVHNVYISLSVCIRIHIHNIMQLSYVCVVCIDDRDDDDDADDSTQIRSIHISSSQYAQTEHSK